MLSGVAPARGIGMTTITPSERRVGFAVMGVWVVILAGLLIEQNRLNPALQETSAGLEVAAERPDLPVPDSLVALGPGESFGPEELSDKIDGRAELYLGAGFTRLLTRRMGLPGKAEHWLELYVYTMESPDAAYAVFSGQRRAGAREVALGDEAYLTDNACFAVCGTTYAEAVAAQPGMDDALQAALRGVLSGCAPSELSERPERELLPAEDQVAGTMTLLTEDAFGFDQFDRLYVAAYSNGAGAGTLFVARRASEDEAVALAASYLAFLGENGGVSRGPELVELFGRYEAVSAVGPWLLGVHEATDGPWAEGALARLRKQVGAAAGVTDEQP